MQANEWPLVCILLLNWNGKEHLEYSLTSVLATDYPNYELVVIDNASTDCSVEYVRENFPRITLLCNERNLQYAAGNNVGIRYAMHRKAKYVAILNNDVKVDPRWLRAAVQAAEGQPLIGFVGFHTFGEFGPEDPNGGQFEAAMVAWQELVVKETSYIVGCATFVRTSVFEYVGGFDEVYVAYGEEDDLETRAMRAGYKMVRVNVPMWHYSMGSWNRVKLQASWLAMRNTLRYAIKAGGWRKFRQRLSSMLQLAANPWCRLDYSNSHNRRMRPSNVFVNACLLGCAVVWNLVNLPHTLAIKKLDDERIARTRLYLTGRIE